MTDISQFIRGGKAKSLTIKGSTVTGSAFVNGIKIPEVEINGKEVRVEGDQVWIDGVHRPDLSGSKGQGTDTCST